MDVFSCTKESFAVIGKEGSTVNGNNIVQDLWDDVNSHFSEISEVCKYTEGDSLFGIWGITSDFSYSFMSWENNFTQGLYLAGVEARDDALAPKGWIKWTVPGFEYLYVKKENSETFTQMIQKLTDDGVKLVGGVLDFINPYTGESFLYFPIKRIDALAPITAYCGLICSECKYYTKKQCTGCIKSKGHSFNKQNNDMCVIAKCILEKQKNNAHPFFCGECPDFPCDSLVNLSKDPKFGDIHPLKRIETCQQIKNNIVQEARKKLTNPVGVCGKDCNTCHLGKWCGGCRVHSKFGSLIYSYPDGNCKNIECAVEHGFILPEQGCYNCQEFTNCTTGCYSSNQNIAIKACIQFISLHGLPKYRYTIRRLKKNVDNFYEIMCQCKSISEALDLLERYNNI